MQPEQAHVRRILFFTVRYEISQEEIPDCLLGRNEMLAEHASNTAALRDSKEKALGFFGHSETPLVPFQEDPLDSQKGVWGIF